MKQESVVRAIVMFLSEGLSESEASYFYTTTMGLNDGCQTIQKKAFGFTPDTLDSDDVAVWVGGFKLGMEMSLQKTIQLSDVSYKMYCQIVPEENARKLINWTIDYANKLQARLNLLTIPALKEYLRPHLTVVQ